MRRKKALLILVPAIVVTCCILLFRAQQKKPEVMSITETVKAADAGRMLYQQHCGTCHLLPEPGSLPKEVWRKGVLPVMAVRMGLADENYERALSDEEKAIEDAHHLIPEKPLISQEQFAAITTYILQQAPDTLSVYMERLHRNQELKQFFRKEVTLDSSGPSLITAIKYNQQSKTFWIGDMNNQVFNWSLQEGVNNVAAVSSPVVDFTFFEGQTFFTEIGDLMPDERSRGALTVLRGTVTQPVLYKLHRPVYTVMDDLDGDGVPEMVVCNFGKNTGSLSLFRKRSKDAVLYAEQSLLAAPGAVKCFIEDMNKDGRKDVVVLMAQADEAVYILYNRGGLQFEPKKVLSFPPHFGTTDLILVDFDKDGLLDVVTAHGDNADYSIVPKKEHGIRLFLNGGNSSFTERFFYPLYGVTRIVADDFDSDGDIDIVANAFYTPYENIPGEAFVYLENRDSKAFRFTSFISKTALPIHSLTLEKADVDDDGDMDLVLGNFALSPVPVPESLQEQWNKSRYGLILMLNRGRATKSSLGK